jgi:hypothetical protein
MSDDTNVTEQINGLAQQVADEARAVQDIAKTAVAARRAGDTQKYQDMLTKLATSKFRAAAAFDDLAELVQR